MNHSRKITVDQAHEAARAGTSHKELALRYGISRSRVSHVVDPAGYLRAVIKSAQARLDKLERAAAGATS